MGLGLLATIMVAASFSVLMTHGSLPAPMTISMAFMILMTMMGFELSSDLVRAQRLARELTQNQERMWLAAQSARLVVWEWDFARDRVWVAEQGRSLLGLDPSDELDFDRFLELVHAEDRERLRHALGQVLTGEGVLDVEYRMTGTGGHPRWYASHGRVVRDSAGESRFLRGVTIDITFKKQSEDERSHLLAKMAHVDRVMHLNELSTSLAHEINQPLGAIINNASAASALFAKQGAGQEEVSEILEDITQDAHRAARVIRNLRAIARREEMRFEALDINEIIREVADLLKSNVASADASLRLELDAPLPLLRGNRVSLQQVLINLMGNALDAMEGCPVRMVGVKSYLETSDTVAVCVTDTGRGIPLEYQEHVFESHFTTKPDGLGMGLRICRVLIDEQGGRIWVAASSDAGSTICFTLSTVQEEQA